MSITDWMDWFSADENNEDKNGLNDLKAMLKKKQSELQDREERLDAALRALKAREETHLEESAKELAKVRQAKKELEDEKAEKLLNFPSAQLEMVEKKRREVESYFADQQNKDEENKNQIFEGRRKLEEEKSRFKTEQLEHLAARNSDTPENYESVNSLIEKARIREEENTKEAQRLADLNKKLRSESTTLKGDRATLESEKAEYDLKKTALESDFREERKQQELELQKLRADFDKTTESLQDQFDNESANKRNTRLEALDREIEADREVRLTSISDEIDNLRNTWNTQREKDDRLLKEKRAILSEDQGVFEDRNQKMMRKLSEIEAAEENLSTREEAAKNTIQRRRDNLEEEIASEAKIWAHSEYETLKSLLETKKNSLEHARGTIKQLQTENDQLELLKKQLNNRSPEEVIAEMKSLRDRNKDLNEEIAQGNTEAHKLYRGEVDKNKLLHDEVDNKKAFIKTMEVNQDNYDELNRNLTRVTNDYNLSKGQAENLELALNEANSELKRIRASYENTSERKERIEAIVRPPRIPEAKLPQRVEGISELTWLKGIYDRCTESGFEFNPRIIKAFHTALKTSELSPITVLAGVSGTGKSELPRLYSHFGGFYFEPLAVQPNWDSQESMLGFYNSIDNKFDAQPALKFLAQSQREWVEGAGQETYPGLNTAMSIVLLDEMNLAHPELYFAEFLSKLELRRGKEDVPSLNVKLGAGVDPYELPLGRNVLWAGTMNQDETTKSLSDKVLDRSIIIHFPRPKSLASRGTSDNIYDKNEVHKLHRKQWEDWVKKGSHFNDEPGHQRIKPYKDFLEKINEAMSHAGRAVGHRVWQSVESYLSNHPDVQECIRKNDKDKLAEAMHSAFEDQLAQKVMPKLRGIETRRGGANEKCLDVIRGLLGEGVHKPYNLERDFEIASKQGYGQFMWQSAEYLSPEGAEETEFDTLGLFSQSNSVQTEPSISSEPPVEVETTSKAPESTERPKASAKRKSPPPAAISSDDPLRHPPKTWKPRNKKRQEEWDSKSEKQKKKIIREHS